MSVIESLRNYLLNYSGLETGAPILIGFLGQNPIEYSIEPLPGDKIIEHYISGGTVREFPFAFQSTESTADDLARMDAIGFYEAFADWLEQQTVNGILPTMDAGKTAIKLEAENWGFLFEQGQSSSGIYQITAKLTYEQDPVIPG